MVNCAVPSCKNDSRRQTKQNSNVTFHRFPKNEELLRKWVNALQRANWEPTIRSFVCSAHFAESSMYFSKSGLRKLVQDAVPEISLNNVEPPKQKVKRKKSSKVTPYMFVAHDKKRDKVKKERTDSVTRKKDCEDSSQAAEGQQKLKKRIINLTKLSKRRRLRCNALYASLNRIRKKVTTMTRTLKDLQQKIGINSELSSALECSGVSTAELFKGLWKKEKSHSPEPIQEEEDYFYSEIPNDIESYIQNQASSKNQITIYSTSIPPVCPTGSPELDVQVSVVKTEDGSPEEPEGFIATMVDPEGFVATGVACHVCLSNVPVMVIDDELREVYEKLVGRQGADGTAAALCRGCTGTLRRARRLADLAAAAPRRHSDHTFTYPQRGYQHYGQRPIDSGTV